MMRRLRLNGIAGGDNINNGSNSIFNRFLGTVLLFMVMTSGVFGQGTITINLANAGGSANLGTTNYGGGAERTWTQSGVTFGGKAITANGSNIQGQASNAVFYNTTALPGRILSIVINYSGTARNYALTGGNSSRLVNNTTANYTTTGTSVGAPSSTGWVASNFDSTNYTYFAMKLAVSSASQISSIVITYETGSTVTFDGNGSTGGTMANQTASTTTALTTNTFTRTGYTFAGWNTAGNGSGTAYADGASFPFTANTTLFAQWTINNYSLAYDGNTNTGGTAPATQNGNYNTSLTVSNEGTLTKTGYSFTGWNTAADGSGTSYAAGATYTVPAANATLYAQWLTNAPSVDYTGSIITFLTTEYGTASLAQPLTIIGNNLTENLTLDMGSMFEYSTDGSTYTNTLSIAPSGGAVNAPIYFRIKANTPPTTTSIFGLLSSSGAIKNVNIPMVTITPKSIFLLGVDAEDKTYDGTTTAVLSGFPFLFSVVGSDSVGFTGPTTGTFNNANAGTNKTVTISDYTLTGLHSDRYTLIQPSGITADIDKRTLAISDPTIAPKVYDGTTVTGTVTPGTLTGLLGSETLVVTATGAYSNADAETGKFATVAYILADGTNGGLAANYFLAIGPGTGDITKANQTITFGTLANKTTADVPFNLTATASSGLPVTYSSSDPSVASVSGNTVTIGASGTAFITASQVGDGNYNAAMNVQQIQLVTSGPCMSTTFPGTSVPSGWSGSSLNATTAAHYQSAPNTRQITGSTDLITTSVNNPSSIRFYVDASSSGGQIGTLQYRIGVGSWNTIGTFTASTAGVTETFPLTSSPNLTGSTNVSFRFTANLNSIYIDDVEVFCAPACTAPTTSATALTVTNPANSINSLNVNFTRGNGDGVLIIAKAGATPAAAPTSGTAYAVNDAIDGGTVVYKGTADGINTATVQTIGSLLEGTQYQFSIYEYVAATNCYQAVALAGSGTTLYREIDIRGNSVSIPSGSTTPSLANHTDFGSTAVDGGSVIRTFTIHNTGNTNLSISNVNWTGSDFVVSAMPSATVAGSNSTTFSFTFNPVAAGLRTSTITIINNDSDEGSYSFTVQGTGINSNASDIIADTGLTYTSNINYASFQSATIPTVSDGVATFRFTIRDGGATATDTDLLGTELTDITFNVANIGNIRTARLYDGTTLISSTPTIGATIAFTGLSGTNVTAPDDGTKTLTLYVSFNTAVTDNDQLQFTVASATANTSGSVFAAADAGGAASLTTGDFNRIEVVADRLVFGTQPASTSINTNLAPFTLRFVDANGNLDFDTNRFVTLTTTGASMSAAASYSITAPHTGIVTVSTVQFTSGPQTGITITGTTTGLAVDNDDVSSPFNISAVVYTTNDYRTTSGGTWSTQNTGTATWQTWNGSSWVSSGRPTSTLNNVYIRHTITSNGNTTVASIIAEGPNASEGTPGGNYTISHGSTFSLVEVQSGGVFNCNATGVAFPTTGGNLIVDNGGKLIISVALANTSNFWRGTENFKQGSIVEISDFSGALLASTSQITTNADNYYFGNLTFSGTTAITLIATNAATNFNLVENDLTLNNASNNILITSATNKNIVINGNTIVNAGTLRGMSALSSLTLNGNLEINNGSVNISPTSNGSIVFGIKLKGDLKVFNSSSLITNDPDSELIFEGIGNGLTPETTQNVFASTTATITNVRFKVNTGAYVKLDSNITLGSASSFTVNSGGTLDFGFDSSNNALQILGNAFEAQTGSTLKITSPNGLTNIAPGATAGNVQVTAANRTFASDASYEYIGITTPQTTGNALPSSVRNLVINNTATNADVVLTNDVIVTSGLTMTQGNINGITNTKTITLGTNASNTGTLSPTTPTGFVKGTMARWFSNATTTGNAGLFPLGTDEASSKNRHAKIDYTTAPTGGKLTASILTATPTLVSPYLIIDGVEDCDGFLTQTVENFNWRLTASDGLANGRFTGAFTKEGTAISDVCEVTLIRKNPTTWEAPTTNAATQGPVTKFTVSRTELNAFGDFGIAHKDNCVGTKTWTGTQWEITPGVATTAPTITEHAVIDGDYDTTTNGALTACSCTVKTGEEVIIQSTNAITLLEGFTNSTGYEGIISIKNNATLLQLIDVKNATDNNNTGKIDMERITKPMYRYDFTYWSSPVFANDDQSDDATSVLNGTEFNLKKLSPMTLFDKYYKWNHAATTPAWEIIPVGVESMVPGRGYIVRAPQTSTYGTNPTLPASYNIYTANFIGVPNNGIVHHNVSGPDKWNLIGNPYPSAISADRFFEANVGAANGSTNTLEGTLYLWTHNTKILQTGIPHIYSYSGGDYASYNGTGSTNTKEADTDPTPGDPADNRPTGFIAAGQSFFIKGTASGEAVFNNGMRIAGDNNQFFRPAPTEPLNNWETTGKHRVWLNMKGQTVGFNQLLVGYVENATNDWDIRFDGESFGGNQVTFYSLLEDKKLTIQGRALPFNNQDEVPLGYKTTMNGTLTISIDEYDGLFEGQGIYLEDKVLNIVHDLKAATYNFTTLTGTFNDRFVLRYLPSEQLSNPDHGAIADGLILYQEDDKIMIKSQLEPLEQVTVYDLLGRNLFNKAGIGQNEIRIENVVMNEQPLIVKVKLANGQIVNKKIVY